jgi:hypothetical protein
VLFVFTEVLFKTFKLPLLPFPKLDPPAKALIVEVVPEQK